MPSLPLSLSLPLRRLYVNGLTGETTEERPAKFGGARNAGYSSPSGVW